MTSEKDKMVVHRGGCHCGAVRYEVEATADVYVYDCDCSICQKKQNKHFIVPASRFKLLQGQDKLTLYQFNTKQAKHWFCKICGVQSFYQPRSNPDGYGIMPHCIDSGTIASVTVETFHGEDWETSMQVQASKEDGSISRWSKD